MKFSALAQNCKIMPLFFRSWMVCLLSVISFHIATAQSVDDSITVGDTTFLFRDDTLFSNKGFNIFVGQRLIAGKGSDENGRYRSISFKSAFAFPLLFMRETEIKNNEEYRNNPSLRDQDKVSQSVDSGQSLIVKKIQSKGRKKKWHYYLVFLSDGRSSFSLKLRCDIIEALKRKELLIE